MHQKVCEHPIARALAHMPLGFIQSEGFYQMRYAYNFELDLIDNGGEAPEGGIEYERLM